MGTPYERTFLISSYPGDGSFVLLPYPGRANLTRIAVTGDNDATAEFYNRANTSLPANILASNAVDGGTQLTLDRFIPARAGDSVQYHDTVNGANDSTFRIVERINDTIVVIDGAPQVAGPGQLSLALSTGEVSLSRVGGTLTVTDTGEAAEMLDVGAFMNLDPLPNVNTGINQALYVKFSAAGTFRVAVRSQSLVNQY